MVLWKQSGYFDGAAELKPLLHTWSLSLEEQYYLLAPALLFFLPDRRWRTFVGIATVASIALCFWSVSIRPAATFFLLPTRAWELGIGSMAALMAGARQTDKAARLAFWPASCALVGLCLWRFDGAHPGLQALIVCSATAIVILRNHALLAQRSFKPLVWTGDISYSLYLVHWPLFAFMHNALLGSPDQQLSDALGLAVVILSFALAWLLNRFVEEPFRHSAAPAKETVMRFAFASSCLLALAVVLPELRGSRDIEQELRANVGLAITCDTSSALHSSACTNSTQPEMLVWGDSFAMHLVPGLAADGGRLVQVTDSNCAPILGVAMFRKNSEYTQEWAKSCITRWEAVVKQTSASPSIHYVILSSPFQSLVDPSADGILVREGAGFVPEKPSIDLATSRLLNTVAALRRAGKKVIVIAPPPATGIDFGRCFERKAQGLLAFGATEDCTFQVSTADVVQNKVWQLLHRLEVNGVPIIDLRPALCSDGICRSVMQGTPIYRDTGHLSIAGSELLGRQMHWVRRVKAEAR